MMARPIEHLPDSEWLNARAPLMAPRAAPADHRRWLRTNEACSGIDTPEDLARLPPGYSGGVRANEIGSDCGCAEARAR
jgi:hypothetical protein